MTLYKKATAVAVLACALAVPAVATAHAAPRTTAQSAGEVDRNLIKPPPGGVLAPVTDAAAKLLPRL
ncbi:hypothetical protein ACFQ61_33170 [Streptomyces sp. NPDC056500]|uniref:hypothetical protein n=1 Tax=Streptomyces sp. NPDC056500 TaxID=3345840 RepID=UPI0036CAF485